MYSGCHAFHSRGIYKPMSIDEAYQPEKEKPNGILLCIVAYGVALAAALLTGYLFRDRHPLFIVGAADIIGTVVIFIFSMGSNNSSLYDPYWSVAPLPIAIYYLYLSPDGVFSARKVIMTALIFIWGIRLTYNWYRGWSGLGHEDWRYEMIRERSGRLYWPASFLSIHFFPTVLVFLGCISVYTVHTQVQSPLNSMDVVALLTVIMAIWFEMTADRQLYRFRQKREDSTELLEDGLWSLCRHPNYFGEVSFWWGLFFFAVAANPNHYWSILGPVVMTCLFVFISIPMIDKRMLVRKEDYRSRMENVPALLPIPWMKRRK